MILRPRPTPRRGMVVVEAAVIYPLLFLLLFGLIVGGLGVFRYQQVACQAREAARWACVRGSSYRKETGQASPTAADIQRQVVQPLAQGMERAKLSIRVEWVDGNTGQAADWDQSTKAPTGMTPAGDPVANRVRVTVTYQWVPEFFLSGPVYLKSVSEIPMSF